MRSNLEMMFRRIYYNLFRRGNISSGRSIRPFLSPSNPETPRSGSSTTALARPGREPPRPETVRKFRRDDPSADSRTTRHTRLSGNLELKSRAMAKSCRASNTTSLRGTNLASVEHIFTDRLLLKSPHEVFRRMNSNHLAFPPMINAAKQGGAKMYTELKAQISTQKWQPYEAGERTSGASATFSYLAKAEGRLFRHWRRVRSNLL